MQQSSDEQTSICTTIEMIDTLVDAHDFHERKSSLLPSHLMCLIQIVSLLYQVYSTQSDRLIRSVKA